MRRNGFTLAEALIIVFCIAIAAIAAAILLPGHHNARELSNRAKCIGHFKNLTPGLKMYSDIYQRMPSFEDGDKDQAAATWTGARGWETTATGTNRDVSPKGRDDARAITSLPWLLVRTNNATPEMFVCPSDKNAKVETKVKDPAGKYYWDFSPRDSFDGKFTISYSWQAPAVDSDGKLINGVNDDDAMVPIMSDKSPSSKYTGRQNMSGWNSGVSGSDVSKFNSPNHTGGEVTQYLTSSYSGGRSTRPDCGQQDDFIFGTADSDTGGAQYGTGESIATHKSTADSYLIGPK